MLLKSEFKEKIVNCFIFLWLFFIFTFQGQVLLSLPFLFFHRFRKAALISVGLSLPFLLIELATPKVLLSCSAQGIEKNSFEFIDQFFTFKLFSDAKESPTYKSMLPMPINKTWLCLTEKSPVFFHQTGEIGIRGDNLDVPLTPHQDLVFTLGCSFTFGICSENETLAYYLNQISGNKTRAINLGVGAGGLQHAIELVPKLRSLYERSKAKKQPIAIYTFLPDHPARFAQRGPWYFTRIYTVSEPSYGLNKNGNLIKLNDTIIRKIIRFCIRKIGDTSYRFLLASFFKIYNRKVFQTRYWNGSQFDADLALFLKGLDKLEQDFHREFPHGKLFFNFWALDSEHVHNDKILLGMQNFRNKNVKFIFFKKSADLPRHHEHRHPTSIANREMAHFLWREIISPSNGIYLMKD